MPDPADIELNVEHLAGLQRTERWKPELPRVRQPHVSPRSLIVEGWRFLPHSYALVNQWQLLAMLRRPDLNVRVVDLPFYGRSWKAQEGLFDQRAEEELKSVEIADQDQCADATLRISFPFNFAASRSRQTIVFGTLENQAVQRVHLPSAEAYERLQGSPPPPEVKALTPSRWSAEGFYRAGFKTDQVLVVPHGIDVDQFHPMQDLREQIRSQLPIGADDFVFLNIGAMSGNKGIDLLLTAFAEVCRKFPNARLLLKGMEPLYKSRDWLMKHLQALSPSARQRTTERILYLGSSVPFQQVAMLYGAADAYVSPYRAEGFNLPVLEAAACGIPIICTGGGATDDFVTDAFAHKVDSTKTSVKVGNEDLVRLEPSVDHLIALMISSIEDVAWRQKAALAGPSHVAANYTWDNVVDSMLRKIF